MTEIWIEYKPQANRKLTKVTHGRLLTAIERWRRIQKEAEGLERYEVATIYRECANDLELALRDDTSLQKNGKQN